MVSYTREAMRTRFWEATAEKEKVDAETKPVRDERDALVAEYAPIENKIRELGKKIKGMESPRRVELDEELAMLARALGSNVGERP